MFNPADFFKPSQDFESSSSSSSRSQSPIREKASKNPKSQKNLEKNPTNTEKMEEKSQPSKKPVRSQFGMDFDADLLAEEREMEVEKKKTLEEKEKFEETQRLVQEERIKKIYKNLKKKGKRGNKGKRGTGADGVKVKIGGRANKLNLKHKYKDKFLGKTNVYKTRYMRNGVAKKFYDQKDRKERDKLNMEADYRISIEELKKDQNLGREILLKN